MIGRPTSGNADETPPCRLVTGDGAGVILANWTAIRTVLTDFSERTMKRAFFAWAAVLVLCATAAVGQVIYNTSSTAAEGYQRGLGAVISAQGEKNLNDSQARINNQDAYSKAIDNSVKSVNAYWEKKDIYAERMAQQFQEVERRRDQYVASRGSIDLSSEEFDRTSGAINWPKILQQPEYDQYRKTLDELFHKRSYEGALSGPDYLQATSALQDWRAAIMSQKDQFPPNILSQMLRFQLKVKRELDDNLS